MPIDSRFDRALDILKELGDLDSTKNPETLGIVGIIFKNLWLLRGNRELLERSRDYYYRGYSDADRRQP